MAELDCRQARQRPEDHRESGRAVSARIGSDNGNQANVMGSGAAIALFANLDARVERSGRRLNLRKEL